ncbi:tetratricopeptide repeat protein [bacterium]|nr:tetratricopeptide repeat protein [bacterium]MDA7537606.1 tetratricopeptide repeat protein [Akkermansiaceae bacterium]MDA7863245.1 tetratricopeptide repeat protein [Akkermansiaceae bacterium]MDA7917216.1 tetratricopeptide repeat protein [Akkermansiaceae bacterium]MDA8876380.1 tetratricopeptide repeat protein [Akkermansiaceae bacterium]
MKRLMTTTMVALSLMTSAYADQFKERAQEIAALYNKGLAEMKVGKTTEAKASFTKVLKLSPGHGHAKYQLSRLDATAKDFKLSQRKAKFKSTTLEVVDFHESTLAEVAEALNAMSSAATKKEWSPNLIIQDPKGKFKGKEITLQMKNVPVGAVLKYALEMSGATLHYDEYATVIRPK